MIEPTEIEWVSQDVLRVPLITPTLPPATRTNTFVLRTSAGLFIVDPGTPFGPEQAVLRGAIEPLLVSGQRLGGFVITHHHRDHWQGLEAMLEWFPAPVVAMEPERIRVRGASFSRPEGVETGGDLRFIPVPGHARDHLAVITRDRDVIAGDVVAGVGTVVIDPPDGNMTDYLHTLSTLLALEPRKLFPAHGPTVEDGCAKLREYLAHRAEREQQVLAALSRRPQARPSDLVPFIYADVPRLLHPVAARSVLAHLLKLESEGRIQRRGRQWSAH